MNQRLKAYLRHLRERGEARTRHQLADELGVKYNTLTAALNRLDDQDLVGDVVEDQVKRNVGELILDRLLELDAAGETTTKARLAEHVDAAVTTVGNHLGKLRMSDRADLVARTVRRANEPRPPRRSTSDEPATVLLHVDRELAAIARDRISGRRLELRIAGLRATLADHL